MTKGSMFDRRRSGSWFRRAAQPSSEREGVHVERAGGDVPVTDTTLVLAAGRRADAVVLAARPVQADADTPTLCLDLEMHAWDEPVPWRVRITERVPMSAVPAVELGARLVVAFFVVDDGESVAVDWTASMS